MAQADPLQRRELVDAGEHDRPAGDNGALPVPRRGMTGRVHANEAEQPVRDEAVCRPDDQVARHEQPRCEAGPIGEPAATFENKSTIGVADGSIIAAIIVTQMPRYQPSRAEIGPGAGVHAAHPHDHHQPRRRVTPTRVVTTPGRSACSVIVGS